MKLIALTCAPMSCAIASSELLRPAGGRELDEVGAAQHRERGVRCGEQAAERDQQHRRRDEDADHAWPPCRYRSSLGEREADEDVALQAEHLLLLLGLRVVEAEEVQHAVGGEQQHLVERGVPRGLAPGDRDLRAHHDVAEQARRGDRRPRCRGAARPSGSSARRSGRARPSTARAAAPSRPRRRSTIASSASGCTCSWSRA